MDIAVCIAGEARTFSRPAVWKSQQRMIEALREPNDVAVVDVFAAIGVTAQDQDAEVLCTLPPGWLDRWY